VSLHLLCQSMINDVVVHVTYKAIKPVLIIAAQA